MMPVVVLAGGLATRLRPVTETIPKSLIDINGKPFVLHQLALFESKGVNKVHFCLGYLGDKVVDVIRNSEYIKKMNITWSFDGKVLLGTGGAVLQAFTELPDHFFITYGDSFLNVDYKEIEQYFLANSSAEESNGLMTVYKNANLWDKSNVVYNNGILELYSKKKQTEEMQYIDYGLGILNKINFEGYKAGTTFDIGDIYENLSLNGNLLGFEVYNRFYEIGSFKGINYLENYLKTIS